MNLQCVVLKRLQPLHYYELVLTFSDGSSWKLVLIDDMSADEVAEGLCALGRNIGIAGSARPSKLRGK